MTQNRTVRRTAAVICFCALFCVLFAGASQLLRNKDSAGAILSLYEEPRDSLDVIFIGSSHILNGVLPLELWQEYGIVSNNLGQHGQSIPISYYMAQEAIRTQHPDLIVLDAYMLYYPDLIYEGDGNSHKSIDNMAWSGPKLRAIFELFSWEDRWDYLVPLSFYHTRWKELSAEDLRPSIPPERGVRCGWTQCPIRRWNRWIRIIPSLYPMSLWSTLTVWRSCARRRGWSCCWCVHPSTPPGSSRAR